MLHLETVYPDTLSLLRRLQDLSNAYNFRLVGGTALALQLGHRHSIDLDFFGKSKRPISSILFEVRDLGTLEVFNQTDHILQMNIDGVNVDFVDYKYDWLQDSVTIDDIVLAHVEDIAAMKLAAVSGRGSKKDFVDVYELLKHYSFGELIGFYNLKFPDGNLYAFLKSICYFTDADPEPMPDMKNEVSWTEIKKTIEEKAAYLF